MTEPKPLTLRELEAGLDSIRQSPRSEGILTMIVRRPKIDLREVLELGELTSLEGLVGDTWRTRGSSRTVDGSSHPDMQLTLINTRLIALVAQLKERWTLAGDQLVVDLDLSADNLPPGTPLMIGTAKLEVTAQPHTGCDKFAARFGIEALKWVNSPTGKQLRLRGLYAKVVESGAIQVGDKVRKT
ncbi:MAG: MOSC domain-containing protein [Terriglobia bacterium]